MAQSLLDKLKIKPIPQKQENFEIKIRLEPLEREDVIIKTKIVDKRDKKMINRDEFMRSIASLVKPLSKKPESVKPITKIVEEKQRIMTNVVNLKEKIIITQYDARDKEREKREKAEKAEKGVRDLDRELDGENRELDGEIKIKRKRITKKPIGITLEGPRSMLQIGDELINNRIPISEPQVLVRASDYYMNNREIFVNFITSLLSPYKKNIEKDIKGQTCENSGGDFSLLTHQKIVRDYINLYTPYRGVLLYHGLGSGKTCSSIAIAEGMKNDRTVIIMTPASLRTNYLEELKKCGDFFYKKNQFWEFISVANLDFDLNRDLINNLSYVLSLSVDYITKHNGAWLINAKKKSNYDDLTADERLALDLQINEMIRGKYKFINYNGLRKSHLQNITLNGTINPFNNAVIIIDEAHNFVSRIVNKIKSKTSISMQLYNYLMDAENVKIILLTGTPIINYPNEIAILFNILRGKIKVYKFKLSINAATKVNQESFNEMFKGSKGLYKFMDYIEYSPTSMTLTITQNPYGFISKNTKGKYDGVEYDGVEKEEQDKSTKIGDDHLGPDDFIKLVTAVLKKNKITVAPKGVIVDLYKALPDNMDTFKNKFIDDDNKVKNANLFKRRILGLTSYFPDIDALLPRYEKATNFHVIKIPMSDFQFNIYEEARAKERDLELANAKKKARQGKSDIYDEAVSTYRIFSRAFCNFVFPRPTIRRPFPKEDGKDDGKEDGKGDIEAILDAKVEVFLDNKDEEDEELEPGLEPGVERAFDSSYDSRIRLALSELKKQDSTFLTPKALEIYSPKFLNILENLLDPDHKGLHLIYTQFRTLEGVGILKLILEANGFTQFKIAKNAGNDWIIDIQEQDQGKPTFALYTGTETVEEKEIIRNIFNGTWTTVPKSLIEELEKISSNNLYGEIIRVLMITASGAEGISLQNVRFVHITEPYWHPVRTDQVIGRARRICSHKNLPKELQTVDVFLYLMTFTNKQLSSEDSKELKLKDKSKIDNKTPLTSDEALYEISVIKENINKSILKAVKEASIDCTLYTKAGGKENLQCFTFGNPSVNKLAYQQSIDEDETDDVSQVNKLEVLLEAVEIEIEGIMYAYDQKSGDIYDLDSFINKNPVKVGTLEIKGKEYRLIKI